MNPTYVYFVKCQGCEDAPFDFFDEAKDFAMSCLTKKPVITQIECCHNDSGFGERVSSNDLGVVWSWEEMMKDMSQENELTTFSKSETLDCDDDYFNCEFDDDDLDSVPDNFRKPIKEDWVDFPEGHKFTKEALYDEVVNKDNVVVINLGDSADNPHEIYFSDGSRYSNTVLHVSFDNYFNKFTAVEWHRSDDGDESDGDYYVMFDSFDELWEELFNTYSSVDLFVNDNPKLAEGVSAATRAPRDTDFVIVSKHPNRSTYSFLGNNYRMTKQLDKAMPYSTKEEAEYDISWAEEQSDVRGSNYDRYTSNQFFVTTAKEAKQLLIDLSWRNAKQLSIEDMTIEALVEKMEENEDTVECRGCSELFDKSSCIKDPNRGYLCEKCTDSLVESTSSRNTVELHYDQLTTEITTKYIPATHWDPPEYVEEEYTDEFDYQVDTDNVEEALWDHCLTDEDVADVPGGFEALEDTATWKAFLDIHFEELLDKYNDKLLELFREDAKEAATEVFQHRYEEEMTAAEEEARAHWFDESVEELSASGETLEESDDEFYARLSSCPECGSDRSFDRKAGRCIECKCKI